ncbi:MAG: SufBD protein [Oscillospiraceae bacterium]
MKQYIISELTSKNDNYACAAAEKIIYESRETDKWYEYFDDFAALLSHKKSLVRNRAFYIIAANIRWDDTDRFDIYLEEYLSHITDEKPISARQCIKSLAQIGICKRRYIPYILEALQNADLSKYKDSMRPLIEKDIEEAIKLLTASGL